MKLRKPVLDFLISLWFWKKPGSSSSEDFSAALLCDALEGEVAENETGPKP